jgi:hypothetical protein
MIGSSVAAFLGAVATGLQFPHYFVAVTPFAAVFAASLLIEIARGWSSSLRYRLHVELLLVVLIVPTLLALLPVHVLGVDRAFRITHDSYEADRAISDDKIASYVAEITSAQDAVYNFGRETQLYTLSERSPAAYQIRSSAFDVEPETIVRSNTQRFTSSAKFNRGLQGGDGPTVQAM